MRSILDSIMLRFLHLVIETAKAYIGHRIQIAGGAHPIFTEQACRLVFRLTAGTPRLINQVADTASAYGFAEQQPWVTASLLSQAAQDRGKGAFSRWRSKMPYASDRHNKTTTRSRKLMPSTRPAGYPNLPAPQATTTFDPMNDMSEGLR